MGEGGPAAAPAGGQAQHHPPGTAPLLRLVPVGRVLHFTPEARCPPGVLPGHRRARGELGRGGTAPEELPQEPPAPPRAANPRKILRFLYGAGPEKQLRGGRLRLWLLCKFLNLHGNGTGLLLAPFSWFFCPAFNEFIHRPAPPPAPSDAAGSRTVPRVPQPNPDGSQQGEQPCFGAVWGKLGQKSCAGWVWQPGSSGVAGRGSGGLQEEF